MSIDDSHLKGIQPDAAELRVPFQDFRAPYEELREELDDAYRRFMESGWFVLGKEVSGFEAEYAAYCGAEQCVGVASGLEALHLALRALGVGAGDEVIVPSNTYIATWLAVTHAGATPVPVEPHRATFNIDPERIEDAITSRTKVILAVNLYGQPCDYDSVLSIAKKHAIKVVIDNAQAQGARYKGQRVGGLADIECHSFYPSKNLGAFGEAGAVTTNGIEIADKVRILRNYGSRVRYHNEVLGYNSRIDELQAAFLRVKLRHLDEWNARRRSVAAIYLSKLASGSDRLTLPFVPEWAEPVWHLFVVRHPQREAFRERLAVSGVDTIIHYPVPPHLSEAYANLGFSVNNLPVAEELADSVLSLPIGPHLSNQRLQRVLGAVASCE